MRDKNPTQKFICNLSPTQGDILVGIFKEGNFHPYGSEDYLEAFLDPLSDIKIKKLAEEGKTIHGSYKGGKVRAFDKWKRRFHISELNFQGQKYGINFDGDLLDENCLVIGKITEEGKVYLNQKENTFEKPPKRNP